MLVSWKLSNDGIRAYLSPPVEWASISFPTRHTILLFLPFYVLAIPVPNSAVALLAPDRVPLAAADGFLISSAFQPLLALVLPAIVPANTRPPWVLCSTFFEPFAATGNVTTRLLLMLLSAFSCWPRDEDRRIRLTGGQIALSFPVYCMQWHKLIAPWAGGSVLVMKITVCLRLPERGIEHIENCFSNTGPA